MLRSGYSSDAVLAEVSSRRLLEPLDPATKKSLVEFNASAQLIAALEGGAYAVPAQEADHARQREAEIAARRAAQVEQDRKLNTLYQAQQAAAGTQPAAPEPPAGLPILEGIKEKLVRCHDGTVRRVAGTELEGKKIVALYFSAHWCGPCRKFTPQLVDCYNRVAAAHPEFELIFVSSDRSRFGWETYIRETKMPWLAIDFDEMAGLKQLKEVGGGSFPSLVVFDSNSRVLVSSYDGEKYLGPQNALAALDQIFAKGDPSQVAQVR